MNTAVVIMMVWILLVSLVSGGLHINFSMVQQLLNHINKGNPVPSDKDYDVIRKKAVRAGMTIAGIAFISGLACLYLLLEHVC